MYPDDFVDKMPQMIWNNGNDIGCFRLVANPICPETKRHKFGEYVFERRTCDDALGNPVWITIKFEKSVYDHDFINIDTLIKEYIKFKIAEKIKKSSSNTIKDLLE